MKVYLSKSNLSDPYLVEMVRQIILNEGYIVHEHHSPNVNYTHDLLDEAHCLVVVPAAAVLAKYPESAPKKIKDNSNLLHNEDFTYGHYIGKGQYEQIKRFWSKSSASDKNERFMFLDSSIIIIEEVGQSEIYTGRCDSIKENPNGDWKISYAKLEINSCLVNLKKNLSDANIQNRAAGIETGTKPYWETNPPVRGGVNIHKGNDACKHEDLPFTKESFMKKADHWEEFTNPCFDGVPHLACRMLYNL